MTDHDITTAIARVTPDLAPAELPDAIADALGKVQHLLDEAKRYKAQLDAAMLEVVQARGPVTVGETLYLIKGEKETKCVDVPATAEAVLTASGGNFYAFCAVMVAQPWKHGACRELLPPDVYAALFHTEVRDKLDRKPVVVGVPTRFIKSRVTG